MKKYNAISLIETLISLTILGVSLIALLPVTTLKKDGHDPTLGNRYWSMADTNSPYISPVNPNDNTSLNIALGTRDIDNDSLLHIGTEGFKNKDIVPLNITNQLRWNGMIINNVNDDLFVRGGEPSYGIYPKNIFVSEKIVVVENAQAANEEFSFSPTDSSSGVRDSDNFYSLEHNVGPNEQDHIEILVNDVENKVIGIGKDAAKYYSGEDFIGIMNIPNGVAVVESSMGDDGGLIIGAKNTPLNYSVPSNFYIYKPNGGNFTFNADQVNIHSLTDVSQIIITSDRRLKNVFGEYKKGIETILKINPVVFSWKKDEKQKEHVGVIAQDLKKVIPNAVSQNNQTGYYVISTDPIFYAIINSIKELNSKNIELEKENKKLEEKIAKLKIIRDRLKASQGGNDEK